MAGREVSTLLLRLRRSRNAVAVESLLVLFLVGVTGALVLLGLGLFAANAWLQARATGPGAGFGDAMRALLSRNRSPEAAWIGKFLIVYTLAIWLGFLAFLIRAIR